jgi:hypothetical protein
MTDRDHPDCAQRVVLGLLLERHPRMLDQDEIEVILSDVPGVEYALRRLADDGLVNRLGNRFGCSRAAVRFDELEAV